MGEPESSNTMKRVLSEYMMGIHTPETIVPYICKVPKEFLDGDNGKYFEPTLVSIGPLHRDPLSPVVELKEQFLRNFIERIGAQELKNGLFKTFGDRFDNDINAIAKALSSLQATIRGCYEDIDPNLSEEEFMKIILLDGCFVVELLMSYDNNASTTIVGNMEAKIPLTTLQQDLLKIENQLPFIVLQTLASLVPSIEDNNTNEGTELVDLALNFLNIAKPQFTTNDEPRNLLELAMNAMFYKVASDPSGSTIVQVENDEEIEIGTLQKALPASELIDRGIKFVPGDCNVLTNVEFDNGNFKIPQLRIRESTMTLYRNFLIFETLFCQSRIFTSYIKFMKTLIKSEEDASYLLEAKIIRSSICDADMLASFFENLSASVSHEDFLFELQLRKENRYCQSTKPYLRSIMLEWYREKDVYPYIFFIGTIAAVTFYYLFPNLRH